MGKTLDRSRMTVREEAFPGGPDDQTVGARYALGVPRILRKLKTPGRDPGKVAFPDRQAALHAALAVFKFGGGGGLILFRECDDGPEGEARWVPVAFLFADIPELVPDALGGGRYAAPEPAPAPARGKARNPARPA